VLGVPSSLGASGSGLLALGTLILIAAVLRLRRRWAGLDAIAIAAQLCLVVTVAAVPYVCWRFVEDLRVTTRLDPYDRAAAGPIQAYMPGYLVDGAVPHVPAGATIAAVASRRVPWPAARAAFPSLVFETLFPRRTVARAADADYVITWGVRPEAVAPVSRVWVARPRVGDYLAVYVGKVRR
jgi:hypothetical protein